MPNGSAASSEARLRSMEPADAGVAQTGVPATGLPGTGLLARDRFGGPEPVCPEAGFPEPGCPQPARGQPDFLGCLRLWWTGPYFSSGVFVWRS